MSEWVLAFIDIDKLITYNKHESFHGNVLSGRQIHSAAQLETNWKVKFKDQVNKTNNCIKMKHIYRIY